MHFAVLFAGVRPRVPEVTQLLTEQLDIPSLHVIGEKDKIKRVGRPQAVHTHVLPINQRR